MRDPAYDHSYPPLQPDKSMQVHEPAELPHQA